MRIVLDTNVFVSGIFFTGPPYQILRAWREGRIRIVYSSAIFEECRRVLIELSGQFPQISGQPFPRPSRPLWRTGSTKVLGNHLLQGYGGSKVHRMPAPVKGTAPGERRSGPARGEGGESLHPEPAPVLRPVSVASGP
jgi:hypothetical protein